MVWGPEPETLLTAQELADFLGTTSGRLSGLATAGILPRDDLKRFPLAPAVRAYIAHVKAKPSSALAMNPELNAEKVRIARESADKLAFQNARARGDLLDAATVAREWQGVVKDLRAALLAVPSRVAGLAGLDRRATAALEVEMRAAMEAIALDPAAQPIGSPLVDDSGLPRPEVADDDNRAPEAVFEGSPDDH